jgi:hypothetical protein
MWKTFYFRNSTRREPRGRTIDFDFLKFETLWASLLATTQQVGIADLTASTALDVVRRLA